ncbi:MAG: hypothetical protein HYZ75_05660 [Elusimicrobia bacterium]|nr:hypothetical protein [Elusimicrobiota bacterium]
MLAAALAALLAVPARAAVVHIEAYDADGRLMDQAALRRLLDPRGASPTAGLRLSAPGGAALEGRPWWVAGSSSPAWRWESGERMIATLPWPLPRDGYSTVTLDAGGEGYEDGRTLLINEEAARWAYTAMMESLKERGLAWKPPYASSTKAKRLVADAKAAVADATGTAERRKRAARFDEALAAVSLAWQQVLFEHGRQTVADAKRVPALRWGLSLDETVASRVTAFEPLARQLADAGADWVRVVFAVPPKDFVFSRPDSFTLYDELLKALAARKLSVMGSVLDSQLWPAELTPELYAERTRNLVTRYKDAVRVWEVASEPNGTWLGGRRPLADETILLCIQKAVIEVKRVDAGLETAATLHWWDGTAPDDRHGLHDWLAWAKERGFGAGLDSVGLSVYPHRHPLGLALEPAFQSLRRHFPGKTFYLGGWGFGDGTEPPPYWWLGPTDSDAARKDLILLFNGAAPALLPESLGGGFYWGTLEHMLPAGRQPTTLYKLYRRSLKDLR